MRQPDIGAAELARHLDVKTASTTALVDRLEGRGLVQRSPHPSDRRRHLIRLTALAPAEVLGALQPTHDGEERLAENLSARDRTVIADFLGRIAQLYTEFVDSDSSSPRSTSTE